MNNLAERLRANAVRHPESTAMHLQRAGLPDLRISNAELLLGAAAYAGLYDREGVAAGEVVILILQHGQELVHAFWGAILHGAIPSIMPFLTEKLSPAQYRSDLAALVAAAAA